MRGILLGVALAAVAYVAAPAVLPPLGLRIDGWQAALLTLAATLVTWLARSMRPEPGHDSPRSRPPVNDGAGVADLGMWQRRLEAGRADPERFRNSVQVRLSATVAERLRQRHGVGLDSPEARRILGDDLHDLVTVPAPVVPTAARLDELIARIEGI
ncbi:hypothetical protein ACIBG8_00310 [Nonomuraea sp. NPDC050556]|uniref:hypothetical protein n=1 Tax=Nonomuraea sp. NPDC050556 TaxID=3364369 RepID=UPI0037B26493